MSASAAAAPSGVAYVKTTAGLDFGRVWSSIFSAVAETPPKSILFVSPGPRQGASTLAAGAALTAAQANPDLRLGLLDCNFRSPVMEQLFQIPASPGTVDALAGTIESEELGYAVGVHSNLSVIPAGQIGEDPLSLLRRQGIATLLNSLSSRFDVLVVDVAPINQYPDAQIIASMFDAVVMVVDVGQAPREAVVKAKQVIESSGANFVGTVLNRRRHPVPNIIYNRA